MIRTVRGWGLAGRFGPWANARRAAAELGRPVLALDHEGRVTEVDGEGRRRRLPAEEATEIRRAWCATGWAEGAVLRPPAFSPSGRGRPDR